jgi:predicted patatin/cPLA2 family phospholipase
MHLRKVIGNLLLKKKLLERKDDRHKAIRPLLLIPGGAMRGAYPTGSAAALYILGLAQVFDNIVGISSGAAVAAYLCSGSLEKIMLGTSIVFEECISKNYINFRRLNRIIDTDYLHHVIRNLKPLDERAIKHGRPHLWIGVTDFKTGKAELINAKRAKPDITAALAASMSVPTSIKKPININGRAYVDGDISMPFPLKLCVEKFKPTDILFLANRPHGIVYKPSLFIKRLFQNATEQLLIKSLVRHRPIRVALLNGDKQLKENLDYLAHLKNVNFGVISPPDQKITIVTQNPDKLRKGIVENFEHTLKIFGKARADKKALAQYYSSSFFKPHEHRT